MTGYLFVALALVAGCVKGYCGKQTSGTLTRTSDALFANIVRMVFCICIGGVLLLFQGVTSFATRPLGILSALIGGLSTALFTVTWLLSVKRGAYMLVEVFLLSGVMLPILLCRVCFGEVIRPLQWVGMALLILAAFLMCTYNKTIKGAVKGTDLLLLLLCALANGTVDFSQKLFVESTPDGNVALFSLLTYLFAALGLALAYPLFKKWEPSPQKKEDKSSSSLTILRTILPYVAVMAVCLFLHSYFKTAAANHLDAIIIYPLTQGGSLTLSLLMSATLFREKINGKCILGVLLSFISLLLINVL